MKTLMILLMCINASVALASSDWDTMIWDQDSWYSGQSTFNGQVVTHATGQKTGIFNAQISIIELEMHVQSNVNGNFTFTDVPDGIYTIKVETDYFAPLKLREVTIKSGQVSLSEINLFNQKDRYSQTYVDDLLKEERMKWDVDNDGKIGIKEAIKALLISAGIIE